MRVSLFIYLSMMFPKEQLKIVETGTLEGINAIEMAKVYPNSKIYTIDCYSEGNEGFMEKMFNNIKPFPQIEFIKEDSIKAADRFDDLSQDYVYLDADHSRDFVYKEIIAWWDKVKWGGMLAGHDWWYKDIKEAVIKLTLDNKLRLFYVGHVPTDLLSQEAELCDWWIWKNEVTVSK